MRAVVQRVSEASVRVGGELVGAIGPGLLVLLGVGRDDTDADAEYLANKVVHLRVFPAPRSRSDREQTGAPEFTSGVPDEAGQMNLSVVDTGGGVLVVSQFTLYGDVRKGRRPGFTAAAPPDEAKRLYERFVGLVRGFGPKVETGVFQAMMDVALVNQGPVTLLLDSHRVF